MVGILTYLLGFINQLITEGHHIVEHLHGFKHGILQDIFDGNYSQHSMQISGYTWRSTVCTPNIGQRTM